MDNAVSSLDWSLIQTFLAVVETGSLSAAARQTGISQPTIGRHIRRMEAVLGVDLFHRVAKGLTLTEQGKLFVPAAREMRDAAGRIAVLSAGQDARLEGSVRITASQVVSHFLLPKILADLRLSEPGIQVDLVPTDTTENLLFREADIAIRMYRPTQLDVVTRHICDLPMGIFASRSYLHRAGMPASPNDMMDHDFVGYDRDTRIIEGMAEMGLSATRETFTTRTDDQVAYWQLVRAGCGLGVGQVAVAKGDPEIVRLFPNLPIPSLPVWLAAHEALYRTPRIRRIWEGLRHGLQACAAP
ncbi:MAG TPA: LysR family transcriptional regulator [Aliiroseovarius sp.]|nr:LysR family transcriptional regulator [Aliiroseovarius sp.]